MHILIPLCPWISSGFDIYCQFPGFMFWNFLCKAIWDLQIVKYPSTRAGIVVVVTTWSSNADISYVSPWWTRMSDGTYKSSNCYWHQGPKLIQHTGNKHMVQPDEITSSGQSLKGHPRRFSLMNPWSGRTGSGNPKISCKLSKAQTFLELLHSECVSVADLQYILCSPCDYFARLLEVFCWMLTYSY